MKHAGHGFKSTHVEHHADGSMTVSHEHEMPEKSTSYAIIDLDDLHDGLEKHLRPEEIEEEIKERGVDPEKLEEVIEPGLHDKALDYLAEKDRVSPDDIEEKVSPGIHKKLERLIKPE